MVSEQFKADLFSRYVSACEELSRVNEKNRLAVRKVYAETAKYDVEKYESGLIPPGGRIWESPPVSDSYIYGLDTSGRPCYSYSEHSWNKRYWEGYYDFTDDLIEYVEYDLASGKPVMLERLFLKNGQKTGFQSLALNGKGLSKFYAGLSNQETADRLQANPNEFLCRIEQYRYEEGRIAEADCWSSFPGLGPQTYKKKYIYDDSGVLEEIREIFPDAAERYAYVKAPDHLSLESLADRLAAEIASTVADALQSHCFASPLAFIQLGYQEIGDYRPYVTVVTLEEQEETLRNSSKEDLLINLFISPENVHVPVAEETYERLYTAFMNKVEEEEHYELATAMIRKVAHWLTTEKLWGKVAVVPDFIAYAVDWSMTPDDEELSILMKDCGMSAAALKKWQALGVLS
ncbi:hypothetical protein [Taibaiella koreensis]|uniref:hypothetical protein n=1 Tax=Taibaiella koreensis TaxID=1268548 RepID=UPI000E59DB4A|nr:hypothetical protein [Taibaiella koreensis]